MYKYFKGLEDFDKISYVEYILNDVLLNFEGYDDDDDLEIYFEGDEDNFVFFEDEEFEDDEIYWDEDDLEEWEDDEEEEEEDDNKTKSYITQDISNSGGVLFKKYISSKEGILLQINARSIELIDKFIHDNFFIKGYIFNTTYPEDKPNWAIYPEYAVIQNIGTVLHEISYS